VHNWAGNVRYQADEVVTPRSVDELVELIVTTPRLRPVGTRHTFNEISDSAVMVGVAGLADEVEFSGTQAWVPAAMTYAALGPVLDRAGFALPTMASLPHISVGGAISTGTHGSGDALGTLATQVSGLEVVTGTGELLVLDRDDERFAGAVVGIGALGVLLRVRLDLVPAHQVRQAVYLDLPWDEVEADFDGLTAAATSVSLFTTFSPSGIDEVWLKQRDTGLPLPAHLGSAAAATKPMHPVRTLAPDNVTGQLDLPGPWYQRMPHFVPDAPPASGREIQSEYLIDRRDTHEAFAALRGLHERLAPVLLIAEIRTMAADDLWLSAAYGRDTVGLHFSWQPDAAAVAEVLPTLEATLEQFSPRPHWGKLALRDTRVVDRYPRGEDFLRLRDQCDPDGRFRSTWLDRVLGL